MYGARNMLRFMHPRYSEMETGISLGGDSAMIWLAIYGFARFMPMPNMIAADHMPAMVVVTDSIVRRPKATMA
jgi:mannose/fructose/N-acetylgalactosamine-specific phosphotransferase system component IIC